MNNNSEKKSNFNPKSTPFNPKSTPFNPKSTPFNPKSTSFNPKSTPFNPKSTPFNPNSSSVESNITEKMYDDMIKTVFSPDGKKFALMCDDWKVKLYLTEDNRHIHTFEIEPHYYIIDGKIDYVPLEFLFYSYKLKFSLDSKMLVIIFRYNRRQTVNIWSLENGDCILKSNIENLDLDGFEEYRDAAQMALHKNMLAIGFTDFTVRVYDIKYNRCIYILKGYTNRVTSIAFSPDGKLLASGSRDGTVKLWSTEDGSLIWTTNKHTFRVRSVAFSPDGGMLASGSDDWTVKLWSTKDGSLIRNLYGQTNDVSSVAFSPDGKVLASGSGDKIVKLWSTKDYSLIRTLEDHTYKESVVFISNNEVLTSGPCDKIVQYGIWKIDNLKIN